MAPVLVPIGALELGRAVGVSISLWLGLTGIGFEASVENPCGQPFGGIRRVDVTYVLANAREDTVPDAGDEREAGFGQLADLVRASGADADRVTAAAREDGSIVLVPWGFDEGCRPIGWTGSWSWATPGVEGFYRGRLRAPDAWIGDRPTFDVYAAVWEGFPDSPWRHPMSNGRPLLTAAELFELYDRLPTAEAITARPYGAVSELVTWRRDAGDLAERYPARTLVAEAFDFAELARLRSAALPFAGTYRVLVQREGETVATFLLRTGSAGSEPLNLDGRSTGAVPKAPSPAPAYSAAARLAADEASLEKLIASSEPSDCSRERGFRAASHEADNGAAEGALHTWSAELTPGFVSACFADSPILGMLRSVESAPAETPDTVVDDSAADAQPFPGVFRQEVDGRFSFRQAALLDDGTPVLLVGDRIDVSALPPPPPVPIG
jgi:hypothetical protein